MKYRDHQSRKPAAIELAEAGGLKCPPETKGEQTGRTEVTYFVKEASDMVA
jgi:hypothetical protein